MKWVMSFTVTLAALWACSPVRQATTGPGATGRAPSPGTAAPATVIVIGTLHGAHFRMASFHPDEVRRMLAAARPDVLAVEARPADLAAPDLGATPDDIARIAIPWARRHGVPVRPIDWWVDGTREQYDAWAKEMASTEEGRRRLEAVPDEMAVHADRFPDPDRMTPAYVESAEFADKDRSVRAKTTELVGEGPGNLFWDTRAAHMDELLAAVLGESPGKRVVVVTGAAHRGDLERWLATQPNVELIPASTLVAAAPVAYTGEEAEADELPMMLFGLVQGPKANRQPDSVDLTFLAQVLEAARRKVGAMPELRAPVAYAGAEALYLGRHYEEALAEFTVTAALAGDAQVFGVPVAALCALRRGHMLDLLGRREEALAVYRALPADSPMGKLAARFIAQPFQRPSGSAPPAGAPGR